MRAAVMRGKQLVVIDDAPEPDLGPGQVRAETIACGICGSDLHALKFPEKMIESAEASGAPFIFDLNKDIVMGHEFSARIVECGPGVTNVDVGDIVVSIPVVLSADGFASIGYSNTYPGGYGERIILSSILCLKVPADLDPRHAALTEPMAVGLHAVAKSGFAAGDAALVLGCGPVGLAVIAALKLMDAPVIVAADFSAARRALAETMGATHVVDPRSESAIDAWKRVDGQRPLVMYEAVGVPGMLDRAMRDAPRQARILVVGVCMEQDTIRPMLGINKELSMQFVLGYTPEEFSSTLTHIASGKIDVAPLITGEVGIAGVPDAFRALASPDTHAKILVEPALG